MQSYTTSTPLHVDLTLHPETESAVISTDRGTWEFSRGKMVTFFGIKGYEYLIEKVYPNGITLINASTSVPMFMSWNALFGPRAAREKSIFLDAALNTGWMEIK